MEQFQLCHRVMQRLKAARLHVTKTVGSQPLVFLILKYKALAF
jgi:hypothetical protein